MSRLRYNRGQAVAHLRGECDALGRFIDLQGPLQIRVRREPGLFTALARAIVYQQLSGKAAATIYSRFERLFRDGVPDPEQARRIPMDKLRGAGLSNNKALAIRDLAEKAIDGTLASRRRLGRMDDDAVIANLCQVRGIGPWTAQMFNLGRPDVMPATDLGIQKGVQFVYGMDELPARDKVLDVTAHLAPYRSAASWYFWLAADTGLIT